jgi:release factor glutamine methyltransferase
VPTISQFKQKYFTKIDALDLELLISAAIKKPREFVLTHPEHRFTKNQKLKIKNFIARRRCGEPIAYILGQKEFYGLEFKVDKNTLIPRPETELIVENVIKLQPKNTTIIDVGTGSGNIIISLAKSLKEKNLFVATDISLQALNIAKQNAKRHKLNKKIKFLQGNLLEPILNTKSYELKAKSYFIVANLPYLSHKIYNSVPRDVKNYEPRSALLSKNNGLEHYKKLFTQINKISKSYKLKAISCFLEFSPEQKNQLKKAIQVAFPKGNFTFFKDLAGKFRIVQIRL